MFTTIEEIRAHRFAGNHSADAKAFRAIDDFADSSASLSHRAEALRIMGVKGMGLDPSEFSPHDDVVVETFVLAR